MKRRMEAVDRIRVMQAAIGWIALIFILLTVFGQIRSCNLQPAIPGHQQRVTKGDIIAMSTQEALDIVIGIAEKHAIRDCELEAIEVIQSQLMEGVD